jgi:hypothetical protein
LNFYGNFQKKPGLITLMYVSLPAPDRLEKKTDGAGASMQPPAAAADSLTLEPQKKDTQKKKKKE